MSATAAALLISTACAALRQFDFERPTLQLDAIEVRSLGLEGGALTLRLTVFNPNEYDIRSSEVETVLQLEDTPFGRAWLEESVQLKAGEYTTIDVPAEFTWEGLGMGARAVLQRGAVDYELRTLLRLRSPFFQRTVELNKRGRVPIIGGLGSREADV